MNEKIETQGKSVDDAINEALLRLGARRDEVDVTVLDEPKGGFLGLIGGRPAKVEVTRKRSRRRGQRRDNKPGEGHDFGEGSGSGRKSRNSRNSRGGQRRSNNNRNDQSRDHAAASGDDQGRAKKQDQSDNQQRGQGRNRNSDSNNDRNNSRNNNRNKGRNNERTNERGNDRNNERSSDRSNERSNERKNSRSNSRQDNRGNSRNNERSNTPNNEQVESRSENRNESRTENNSGRRPRNQRGNFQKREIQETRPAQVQEKPIVAAPAPQQEAPVVETKRPRSIRRERPARKKPAAKTTAAQPHEIDTPLELTPLRNGSQGDNDRQPRDDYQSPDANRAQDSSHSSDDRQPQQESFSQPDRQSRSRRPERGGRNDRYNQRDNNEPRAARVLNSAPDEIIATGISAGKYAKPARDIDLEKLNDTLEEMTTGLLARAGFPADCDVSDGEYRQVRVTTGDESAGMLIGRHGATIDSVEHLVERMVSNAAGDRVRMNLDINEYRTRRHESLLERVADAVTQIRENGKTYHVEPMNARERRIVHLAVEEYSDMRTFTMDSHRGRHVVIALDRGENDEAVSSDAPDSNHESQEMDDRQ